MFGLGNVAAHKLTIDAQEEMIDNLVDENYALTTKCEKLESELIKAQSKTKKRRSRPQLSRKTGYRRVTEEESLGIFELYQNHVDLSEIATHFNRSQSCVSKHVRKQLGE